MAMGQNLEAFWDHALPPAVPGAPPSMHYVAVGEIHQQSSHLQWLAEHWQEFSDPKRHNVGTLGIEDNIAYNVFLQAARDHRLPVERVKGDAYLRQVFDTNNPRQVAFDDAKHRLMATALKADTQLLAFDVRDAHQDYALMFNSALVDEIRSKLPRSQSKQEQIRLFPAALDEWVASIQQDPELAIIRDGKPQQRTAGDLKYLWKLSEIKTLLEQNPDYMQRYKAMVQNVDRNLPPDQQSAAFYARYANPANGLTISGLSHITGREDRAPHLDIQGTFAAHLATEFEQRQSRGEIGSASVTPVLIASRSEFHNQFSQRYTTAYNYSGSNTGDKGCVARAPLHLVIPDDDAVINVSTPEQIRLALAQPQANQVAQVLLDYKVALTCNNPDLPTIAQVAAGERPAPVVRKP